MTQAKSGECPEALDWFVPGNATHLVLHSKTRHDSVGNCVTDAETVNTTFAAGAPGTSRTVEVALNACASFFSETYAFKSVEVVTPADFNTAPKAAFFPSVEPLVEGKPVAFDAHLSSDAEGSVAAYSWRVDNGPPSGTDPVLGIQFSQGLHTVELTVTDARGLADTKSVSYSVEPPTYPAYAGFSISPAPASPGQDVTVTPEAHPQNP